MPADSHFSVNCFPSPPSLCSTLKLKYPNATDLWEGDAFLKTSAPPLGSPRRARRVKFGFTVEVGAYARLGGVSPHLPACGQHMPPSCAPPKHLWREKFRDNAWKLHTGSSTATPKIPERSAPWTVRSVTSIVAPRQNMGDVLKKYVHPSHSLLHTSLKKNTP